MLGINRSIFNKEKKNLLPPFSNEDRWRVLTGVESIDVHEYEVGFTADLYRGLSIGLDDDRFKGKNVSISAEAIEGDGRPIVILRGYINGERHQAIIREGQLSSEGFYIPANTTDLSVKIEAANSSGGYCFIKNLQLEEGLTATDFVEYKKSAAPSIRGLYLDGQYGAVQPNLVTETPREFLIEADVTYLGKSNNSNYAMIWQGNNATGTYLAIRPNQENSLFISVNTSEGQKTQYFDYNMTIGKRTKIRVEAKNSRVDLYVDGEWIGRYYPKGTFTSRAEFLVGSFRAISGSTTNTFDGIIHNMRFNEHFLNFEEMSDLDGFTVFGRAKLIQRRSRKSITGKNLVPDFSKWEYSGGARYENGKAILEGYGATVQSPFIDLTKGYSRVLADVDAFSYDPSRGSATDYNIYAGTVYYDENGNRVENDGGWTGNGHTRVIGKAGEWSGRDTNWQIPLGAQVRYMTIRYALHQNYTSEYMELKDPMIRDYIFLDNVYEPYKIGNRPSQKAHKNAFMLLPYDFDRGDSISQNGAIIPINTPRFKDGGVIVEEGTKNVHVDIMKLTIADANNTLSVYETDELYNGNKTRRLVKIAGTPATHASLRAVIDVVPSTYNSLSYYAKMISGDINNLAIHFRGGRSSFHNIEDVGGGWYKISFNTDSDTLRNYCGIGVKGDDPLECLVSQIQYEYKPYATSFIQGERKQETLTMQGFSQYIDQERGSIEFEVSPLCGEGIQVGNYGFQDINWYDGKGFIIRRNRTRANVVEVVVRNNGVVEHNYFDLTWKNGDTIKYRIEWNTRTDKTIVRVNEQVKELKAMEFASVNTDLAIGHRRLFDYHTRGNAVFKNLVVRDRWGKTVFKL